MNKEFQTHKNSVKTKNIITVIALIIIFTFFGGSYALSTVAHAEIAISDDPVTVSDLPDMSHGYCGLTKLSEAQDFKPSADAFYNTVSKLYVYLNEQQIYEGTVSGPNTTYYRQSTDGTKYNYICVTNFRSNTTGYSDLKEIINTYTNFKVTTSSPYFGGATCTWDGSILRFQTTTYTTSAKYTDNTGLGGYNVIITCEKVPVQLPPTPSKEGHHFVGWYYDEQFERPYNGEPIYEDTELYAKFEINTYTVTFNSNGGSSETSQKVDWNTSPDLPTPTRTGYTFKGWYLSDDTPYTDQPIKEDTTLTAHWEIIKCTITFYVDGEEYETLEVDYGTTLSDISDMAENMGLQVKSYAAENGESLGNKITTDIKINADKIQITDNNKKWLIIGAIAGGILIVALIMRIMIADKKTK